MDHPKNCCVDQHLRDGEISKMYSVTSPSSFEKCCGECMMNNGMLVWGTCSQALLHNVERIHLRAAKIIYSLADVNLETLKYIGWQPLLNAYKLKLTSLMYSVYYGLAPKPICDLFHKTELRRYHLRRAEGFNVPKYN